MYGQVAQFRPQRKQPGGKRLLETTGNCALTKRSRRLGLRRYSCTVSEHFLSHSNHSHTDMQLIPLEKIHSSRDSVRKARESHLIDKAMTLEPYGLNRRGELL